MADLSNIPAGGADPHRRPRLGRDGRGVTAVEYGIVAAFLCLALLGIFSRFGAVLTSMFNSASAGI